MGSVGVRAFGAALDAAAAGVDAVLGAPSDDFDAAFGSDGAAVAAELLDLLLELLELSNSAFSVSTTVAGCALLPDPLLLESSRRSEARLLLLLPLLLLEPLPALLLLALPVLPLLSLRALELPELPPELLLKPEPAPEPELDPKLELAPVFDPDPTPAPELDPEFDPELD